MGHPLPGSLTEAASLRPEKLEQRVQGGMELTLDITLADALPPTDELSLETSDERLSLQLADGMLDISFCVPVNSDSATAKISRKRRTLSIRAPLLRPANDIGGGSGSNNSGGSSSSSGSSEAAAAAAAGATAATTELRATIGGLWRGQHFVHIAATADEVGKRCYVLVSRNEAFPTRCNGGYQWCFAYVPTHAGQRLTVRLDAYTWVWEPTDALLTYGVLADDEEAPAIEPGLEQVGVDCFCSEGCEPAEVASAQSPGSLSPGRLAHEFVPDESRLPTAELRLACRRYYAAFASVDAYQLAGDYQRNRPPPPRWELKPHSSGGGASRSRDDAAREVVDTYYSSLTYGEAEFVPLHALLVAVGVPPDGVLVDLGSGSGRMVLCAATVAPGLREVRGIELVPGLHTGAERAYVHLRECADVAMAPVRLIQGDVLQHDWSDADLVLATSLCFPYALQMGLHEKTRLLKPGAKLVVMQADFDVPEPDDASTDGDDDEDGGGGGDDQRRTGAPDPDPPWLRPVEIRAEEPRHQVCMQMSFGEAKFYVYERVANDKVESAGRPLRGVTELT